MSKGDTKGTIHEHSEDIADERNPIDELHMDISPIRRLGINSHIKKHPPPQRKLPQSAHRNKVPMVPGKGKGIRTKAPEV